MPIFIKDLVDHANAANLAMDINDFSQEKENAGNHRVYVAEQLPSGFDRATHRLEFYEIGFVIRESDGDLLDAALDAFEAWIEPLPGTAISSRFKIREVLPERLIVYKADDEYNYYLGSWKFYVENQAKI